MLLAAYVLAGCTSRLSEGLTITETDLGLGELLLCLSDAGEDEESSYVLVSVAFFARLSDESSSEALEASFFSESQEQSETSVSRISGSLVSLRRLEPCLDVLLVALPPRELVCFRTLFIGFAVLRAFEGVFRFRLLPAALARRLRTLDG